MNKLLFVRHGESEANQQGVFGWPEAALTERGREQALAAGSRVGSEVGHVDVVIASPFNRAIQTAEIIIQALNQPELKLELDERLREVDAGRYIRQPTSASIRHRLFQEIEERNNPAGAEWIGSVIERTQAFVDDVMQRPDKVVLLVGHDGSGKTLRRIFAKINHENPIEELDNSTVVELHPHYRVLGAARS